MGRMRQWTQPHTPSSWRGPRCARHGCSHPAWFAIHHIPVCSSRCAEQLATEVPRARELPLFVPVVRAVRWTHAGTPWTLVIASCGRRHDQLRAWWWAGRGQRVGALTRPRGTVDVLTEAGLFAFLRRLTRAGATEVAPLRLLGSSPPWTDVVLTEAPEALARRTVHRARAKIRRAEQVAALRARYRQRGTIQDGTTAHAARVA